MTVLFMWVSVRVLLLIMCVISGIQSSIYGILYLKTLSDGYGHLAGVSKRILVVVCIVLNGVCLCMYVWVGTESPLILQA